MPQMLKPGQFPSHVKLGKHPARHDARTLRLCDYTNKLPPPPLSVVNSAKLSHLGMMLNDQLGDCTCAAVGHLIQLWTAANGDQVILGDPVIQNLYQQFGYDPTQTDKNGDNPTDGGAVELDVLNYWRKNPVAGHELLAYADVSATDLNSVRQAIDLFGAVYIGVQLPETAQGRTSWNVVPNAGIASQPGSWGGHAVIAVDYTPNYFTVVTWGALVPCTVAFWEAYVDEVHVPLGKDWLSAMGATPAGLDLDQLQADLALVTQE